MLTRTLQSTDFTALATYLGALAPDAPPITPLALQEKECQARRQRNTGLVLTLTEDAIVATVRYSEARSSEDLPGTFWLYFNSLPDYLTATVLDALYQGVIASLSPQQPTEIGRASCRERV